MITETFADNIFWFLALSGGALFLARSLLMFIGLEDKIESEEDDYAHRFSAFSLHSLSAFSMVFGWSGHIFTVFHFNIGLAVLLATGCGICALYILKLFFLILDRLLNQKNVFNIRRCIGKIGYVYHSIPVGGAGKIMISVDGLTHEVEAVSDEEILIPSFVTVQVMSIVAENKVSVRLLGK